MMKILVIGGGGREHAICRALRKSAHETQIFCAPGNAGISELAECVDISALEIDKLADFAAENAVNLTVVGGETSLAAGIADEFIRRGLKIVGASQAAARLESSKIFAKDFMLRHSIPTAKYRVADCADEALDILKSGEFGDENSPVVVKADGLAAGKGVVVAQNRREAETAIFEMMEDGSVGTAAHKIVLEETLFGREISLLLFADGENFALMPSARDHKRIGENDTGANTGGMGTICDDSLLNENQRAEIIETIVKPTLRGAAAEDFPFRGVLFLGLMMTDAGAKVIEYNVRFGDPEAQSILLRLETDFLEICQSIVDGKLSEISIKFDTQAAACVIMAARNYPQRPETGDRISGLDDAAKIENVVVFHGGTKFDAAGEFVTNGGRVLGVTAKGETLNAALEKCYAAIEKIGWNGAQFRRDIGRN